MVEKKHSRHRYAFIFGGIVFVSICLFVVLNEVKRHQLIKKNELVLSSARKKLEELSATHDHKTSKDVVLAQQDALGAEKEIAQLKSRWKILTLSTNSENYARIKRLITVNQELVDMYRQEIDVLLRAGESADSGRVVFVRQKLSQAEENITELSRKLQDFSKEQQDEEREKVEQLLAVYKESITAYRQEIAEYLKLGVSQQDPKIRFAHDQIIEKSNEIARLEKML